MNDIHQLAAELNKTLEGTIVERLLSGFGKRVYFPKGIVAQAAEAKAQARFANATIGMAYRHGKPLRLPSVAKQFPGLSEAESVAYAPTAGVEKLRELWKEQILKKNAGLLPDAVSLPVIVPGITAGLSYAADLFLDQGDVLLASDPCWDNYPLIFEERRRARIRSVPFLSEDAGAFNLRSFEQAVNEEASGGTVRLILNFPNNPVGYSPLQDEAAAIISIIEGAAAGGADVLAFCDDAYFGLFYEDGIFQESFFGRLSRLHERVLAVKIDGPTKEDYVWGLRLAALSFGSKGLGSAHYEALVKKTMGVVRSSVSCANTPAQYSYLKVYDKETVEEEKQVYFEMLKKRYLLVKKCLAEYAAPPELRPLPFNSGYFMSFKTNGLDAEALRLALLKERGIGTVAIGSAYLRLAFASLDDEVIPEVYRVVYETARELGKRR